MTNNINYNPSFMGNYYYSTKDIENLAKYATGVAITNKDTITPGELAASTIPDITIKGLSWLKNNKGNYANALKEAKAQSQALHDIYKSGGSFINGVKAVNNVNTATQILGMIPDAEKLGKFSKETQALYAEVKTAAELAKSGKGAISEAGTLLSKANAAAYAEATSQATGIFSKAKNALGITKFNKFINNLAVKSPKFGKCLNTFRAQGGGIMLALEGGTEVITNVIPTFKKLGAKSGAKQVGKSAVKTVSSVGGWVAGAALGTKLGALIGSVVPGAGTAIGAGIGAIIGSACSLIGGALGSRLGKGLAEKVVGKDELVLAQEQEAKNLAQQAQTNSTVLNNVVNVAFEKLNNEGIVDKDSQIAYDSLKALSETSASTNNASLNTNIASSATNPFFSTTNTSFNGLNPQQSMAQQMQDDMLLNQYAAKYGLL